jgi:dGTPase
MQRLKEAQPESAIAAAQLDVALVASSTEISQQQAELQRLLFERVYRHPAILEQRAYACDALHEMFAALMTGREPLPAKFSRIAEHEGLTRAAVDYLAGMTDHYALERHDHLVRNI